MKKRRIPVVLSILCFCILLTRSISQAQNSAHYTINPHVIASGGGPMSSGNYALDTTTGQIAPGFSSSRRYHLAAGYWEVEGGSRKIYLPIVSKQFGGIR
jgi:hypothetical protein